MSGTPESVLGQAGIAVRRLASRLSKQWREGASASDLVEQAIVLVFVVLRIGLVVQISIAAGWMMMTSAGWAAVAITIGAGTFSVAIVIAVLRAGRIAGWPWGILDLTIAGIAVVASGLLLSVPEQPHDLYNWAVGYSARAVPFVVAWHRSIRVPAGVGVGFGGLYFGVETLANGGPAFPVLANAIDVPIYAVTAAVFVLFGGRVAARADQNQLRAVELGAQLELTRYQHHIHNATGLLARLARDDTPQDLLPSLRAQASQESNRLRQEILDAAPPARSAADDGETISLASVVWEACAGFTALPLEIRTNLGRQIRLSREQGIALRAAVVALLYNVQFHAHAAQVVVHADCDEAGWEVTVADDGAGFDPDTTAFGFGLASQVIASLNGHGISVDIDSQPGEGTCLTIRAGRP